MIVQPERLRADLSKGEIAAVYLLTGSEELLRREAVAHIARSLLRPGAEAFDRDILYGGEDDLSRVPGLAATLPMLSPKRLVVVRHFDRASRKEQGLVLEYAQSPSPSACVVLECERADLRRGYYRTLAEHAVATVFWPPFERQARSWLVRRTRSEGIRLSPDAADLLLSAGGERLADLAGHVEKLALYAGPDGHVSTEDVSLLIGSPHGRSIFELCDAVGSGSYVKAFEILDQLRKWGEAPFHIQSLLARHFLILWRAKTMLAAATDEGVARRLGLSERNFRAYARQSERLSEEQIREGLVLIFRADREMKSGARDRTTVLDSLVYQLSNL
jgi:DNA polymerase-3 subunit delta